MTYCRPDVWPYGPTDQNPTLGLGVVDATQAAMWLNGTDALTTHTWVSQSYMEFAATASAVPSARRHVRQVLGEWGLQELADVAEQVVSELVTNAIRASLQLIGNRPGGRVWPGGPRVRLWLVTDGQQVLMQVWDGSERMPEPRDLDPESEHGRGLWLVEALSEDWGAFRPAHASGKVTWAAVAKS